MARRNQAGEHLVTRTGLIRGRENEGRVAVVQRSADHSRIGRLRGDGTCDSSTERLVPTAELIDVKPTHVVSTGQRGTFTIPADFRIRLDIEEETPLMVVQEDGWLAIRPLPVEPPSNAPPTLEELLARITPENIHEEFDIGPPIGRELF